ncbi:xyloglucan galactosyltransferase XLT2-like [Primulina tabacum]|uniref:xyloglucan galactosyltransferase XLT2-like n=1 Tax=Primulina tabacum TaxID=48773 RepID=UPI003F59352A
MPDPSSSESQSRKKDKKLFYPRNMQFKSSLAVDFLFKIFLLFAILVIQVLILHFIFRAPSISISFQQITEEKVTPSPPPEVKECNYGYVYVYELPAMFNKELLENCHELNRWQSRCRSISNVGLGPRAFGLSRVVPENLAPAWYWTDMFAAEVIYHDRILKHKCRTREPESATAFYIPFYAGLAVAKYFFKNYSAKERDRQCEKLLGWVKNQAHFKKYNGSDHFIMLGRPTWDFRRSTDEDWGSGFIYMPLMKRILRLSLERDPWDKLEIGVPYPTGFHPRSKSELDQWLNFVRTRNRTSLFTFAGAKRNLKGDFRTVLMDHCYNESGSCRVVDCSGTRCSDGTSEILEGFLDSDFCLQPRGDTYTRKSMFDCMLAGSIPVFFWKRSIYDQYEVFLGNEPEKFTIFIDWRDVRNGTSIREVLEGYSRDEVKKMREMVINLIPNFLYSSMRNDQEIGYAKDAFDIVIDEVLKRFKVQKGVEHAQS